MSLSQSLTHDLKRSELLHCSIAYSLCKNARSSCSKPARSSACRQRFGVCQRLAGDAGGVVVTIEMPATFIRSARYQAFGHGRHATMSRRACYTYGSRPRFRNSGPSQHINALLHRDAGVARAVPAWRAGRHRKIVMSGKRGPKLSSLGPTSGLNCEKLM